MEQDVRFWFMWLSIFAGLGLISSIFDAVGIQILSVLLSFTFLWLEISSGMKEAQSKQNLRRMKMLHTYDPDFAQHLVDEVAMEEAEKQRVAYFISKLNK